MTTIGKALVLAMAASGIAALGAAQTVETPQFEVASIKRNTTAAPGTRQLVPQPSGRLVGVNTPVRMLIYNAYQLRPYQVVGGPGWIDSDGYDIDVRATAGQNITPLQTMAMLQPLLADRFMLKFHREPRELPVYSLQVAKTGPKLQRPQEGSCINSDSNTPGSPIPTPAPGQPPLPRCGAAGFSVTPQGARLFGGKISVRELVYFLSIAVARPVIDKTGLTDTFDVNLSFLPDQATAGLPLPPGAAAAPDPNAVTIFTALQEQLGLKLDSDKGPVEVLVIDSVQRPSEN
jgi:uncharacterized protein (TIGR03435 family)